MLDILVHNLNNFGFTADGELVSSAKNVDLVVEQSLADFLTTRQGDTTTTAVSALGALGGRKLARFLFKFLQDYPATPSEADIEGHFSD
jgi:hypothetical protein